MPTAKKGVSHLMLGKTGDHSMKWLQADTSASALIFNPAVLTGVSGLLASFSQQLEAKELHEFMARVDARLDDVLTNQRNETLADIETAAEQIEDALSLLESDGDPQTIWELVRSADDHIATGQNKALKTLGSVADSAKRADSSKEMKKLSQEIEGKVNLWLSVLARCFELKDQFNVIELDYVMMTAPKKYDIDQVSHGAVCLLSARADSWARINISRYPRPFPASSNKFVYLESFQYRLKYLIF